MHKINSPWGDGEKICGTHILHSDDKQHAIPFAIGFQPLTCVYKGEALLELFNKSIAFIVRISRTPLSSLWGLKIMFIHGKNTMSLAHFRKETGEVPSLSLTYLLDFEQFDKESFKLEGPGSTRQLRDIIRHWINSK